MFVNFTTGTAAGATKKEICNETTKYIVFLFTILPSKVQLIQVNTTRVLWPHCYKSYGEYDRRSFHEKNIVQVFCDWSWSSRRCFMTDFMTQAFRQSSVPPMPAKFKGVMKILSSDFLCFLKHAKHFDTESFSAKTFRIDTKSKTFSTISNLVTNYYVK